MGERLRTLRVQVSLALLVAAAVCAWVASKSSGDELAGAYRDSSQELLVASGGSFARQMERLDPRSAAGARRELKGLLSSHPELSSASVWTGRPGDPHRLAAVMGDGAGPARPGAVSAALREGRRSQRELRVGSAHVQRLTLPFDGGQAALELDYDLRRADQLVSDRNRRIALVLGALLLGFAGFTFFVLGRGIFTPLDRLRAATKRIAEGDLESRLGWPRRDEIGLLARDFDDMATELDEKHGRLEALALQDPLTGLANHRRLQEALAAELARAREADEPLAVVVLDIDRFKRLNDARGHPYGDRVLSAVGERLHETMRGLGVAARLGGDEFALVLPEADATRAYALAEAARAAIFSGSEGDMELTCSAGLACYPHDARNADALIQLADGALYWAKKSGRDQTRRYDPEHVLVVTDEQRAEFAGLVARPEAVRSVYQPIVALATGEVVGYEALARFDRRPGLPPSWWFSQAHRFGLGSMLEAEAVSAALALGMPPVGAFLSVNVSPTALESPEVYERLPEDLGDIVIEITEEERITDPQGLQAKLVPLRARGARIAVDDAGAGYAGLQQVMHMQADIIKLDRELVDGVHLDPAKVALVGSLVQFARGTGAKICAEGIESLDELRVLIHLGVAYGQGYVLARPGEPWPAISDEAGGLCRALMSEAAPVVPLGRRVT